MPERIPSFRASQLARAAHTLLGAVARDAPAPSPRELPMGSELVAHVGGLALSAGYAMDVVDVFDGDLDALLGGGAPFVALPFGEDQEAFVVIGRRGRSLVFLDPQGSERLVPVRAARVALLRASRGELARLAQRLAGTLAPSGKLVEALGEVLDGASPIALAFVFRSNQATTTAGAITSTRPFGTLLRVLVASSAQSLLALVAWSLVGALALTGHADRARLLGWGLVSLTGVALQVALTHAVARFSLRASTALRERLLESALALDPDALGAYGLGGLMVLASQSEGFFGAAIGALLALLSVATSVAAAVVVLAATPAPAFALGTYVLALVVVLAAIPRVIRLESAHQTERTRLTTDTVERMVGHATRLVQQTPNTWHDGEDERVAAHALAGDRADRLAWGLGLVPRVYYVTSALALVLVLVARPEVEALALALGGMVLGMSSLAALVDLALSGSGLVVLWRAVTPVLGEGPARARAGARDLVPEAVAEGDAVLELRDVSFGYPGRAQPVFAGASLVLHAGDRVLVEGPSGGGKTTLAALLSGSRRPTAGSLRVLGLDQHTIETDDLRRAVASAPQFYRNHVFAESLAFNLLLSRPWPPTQADLAEAREVCEAVGLGPLLSRMPAGLYQHVGETGWQLSHGEKSRVYLARTLLQRAEVVLLDETFGALDPDTLFRCMSVVEKRARTLVVITHR